MTLPRPPLHRIRVLDQVLFWPALALVAWGELFAEPLSLELNNGDKYLHFIAYFGLAAMAAMASATRRTAIKAVFAVMVLGWLLEGVQIVVGRDSSVWDGLTNMAGALTGAVLARLIVEPLRRRFAADFGE